MKSLLLKIFSFSLALFILSPITSAYQSRYKYRDISYQDSYNSYRQSNYNYNNAQGYNYYGYNSYVNPCNDLTSLSVGVGNLSNGVNVSVTSYDSTLQNCIKNMSWSSYFSRFGNTVTINVTNTTLGVQIIATSYDSYTVSNLQNAGWSYIITGNHNANYNTNYYNPNYIAPQYPYNYNTQATYNYIPTCSNNDNRYRNGSDVFGYNVRYIARSLAYIQNGIRMNLTSADYNTMIYLQRFSFLDTFSYLPGVSISQSIISGGIQVTVTSGNTSTVQEIQNAGYYLINR